jgi:hypothetical protein
MKNTKTIKMHIPDDYMDSVKYIIDTLHEIKNNPNHGFPPEEVMRLSQIENEIADSMKGLREVMQPLIKLTSELNSATSKFRKDFEKLNKRVFGNIVHICAEGWYVSPNIIERYPLDELAKLGAKKNVKDFEKRIVHESDQHIPSLIKNAIKLIPERAHIFEELFKIYKGENYHATITLAYSQIDGICVDQWGDSFWKYDNNVHSRSLQLHGQLQETYVGINSHIADQLGVEENEITMKTRNNTMFDDHDFKRKTYNRHKVMHGNSIHYGTKINAIRALYLLDFICYFVQKSNQANINP